MAFIYSRTVYLGDTDAAGVVYFARAMEMCHEAYEESLRGMGVDLYQLLSAEIAFPIVNASINFYSPIVCGDKLIIHQIAHLVKDSEFKTTYEIVFSGSPDQTLIKGSMQHVAINIKTRTRIPLPAKMIQWINNNQETEYS